MTPWLEVIKREKWKKGLKNPRENLPKRSDPGNKRLFPNERKCPHCGKVIE